VTANPTEKTGFFLCPSLWQGRLDFSGHLGSSFPHRRFSRSQVDRKTLRRAP
jgi:hypothetical protein